MEEAISSVSQIGARHVMKRKRGTDLAGMPLNAVSEGKGEGKKKKSSGEPPSLCFVVFGFE